jgi:hypothetical protein
MRVPVAQPDRVFGYEPKGRGFESLRARHAETLENVEFSGVFLYLFEVGIFGFSAHLAHRVTKNGFDELTATVL